MKIETNLIPMWQKVRAGYLLTISESRRLLIALEKATEALENNARPALGGKIQQRRAQTALSEIEDVFTKP